MKVWYDAKGDYLEVLFDQRPGYFRETTNDQVMEKVDAEERSRLAREDTLCWASLSGPERRRLATRRSADARRWNLLTAWTVDALRYRP